MVGGGGRQAGGWACEWGGEGAAGAVEVVMFSCAALLSFVLSFRFLYTGLLSRLSCYRDTHRESEDAYAINAMI